jgi:Zn-dependent protease
MDLSQFLHFDWYTLPFRLIAFVIAFSLHEWAHAYVAWRLGDNTAQREGRLTINPIPHIDPFGLLLILFGPFGWAKPVPVNPFNFRGNKRLGMVCVAAAGPFVNLVLAFLFTFIFFLVYKFSLLNGLPDKAVEAIRYTLSYSFIINCGLLVFNLLPISPLDGSNILRFLAPKSWGGFFYKLDLYGPWILLLLVFIPTLRAYVLGVPLMFVTTGIENVVRNFLGM